MPEYAFLEPRGMGIFDGKEAAAVLPEVRLVTSDRRRLKIAWGMAGARG